MDVPSDLGQVTLLYVSVSGSPIVKRGVTMYDCDSLPETLGVTCILKFNFFFFLFQKGISVETLVM